MFKNIASQKIAVYAHDTSADTPKTGDAANITARISKDGGAVAQSNDANPTELDATHAKGIYLFDLLQAETNCDLFVLSAVSSTGDIQLEPIIAYTIPQTADVNVTQISGDSAAADNLEAILDGTGAVLTLSQLRISSSAAGGAIDIDNDGGPAISVASSNDDAVLVSSSAANGSGIVCVGNGSGHGMSLTGGGSGHDLSADIHGTIDTATAVTNRVTADMTYIHGTALTETAGQLAGRFTNFFDQDAATFNVKTPLSSFMAICLDAAGIRTAVGLASANLDTQLGTLSTTVNISTEGTNISSG